ncbi:MAG: hypothetical protein OEY22_08360 [Candidatus Bathyarchaeota archaeon]|nr:hypothetical protein [Candidatus Bathyarchaeota archaeon]
MPKSKGLEFCNQCGKHENNFFEKFGELAQKYLEAEEDIRANLERIRRRNQRMATRKQRKVQMSNMRKTTASI